MYASVQASLLKWILFLFWVTFNVIYFGIIFTQTAYNIWIDVIGKSWYQTSTWRPSKQNMVVECLIVDKSNIYNRNEFTSLVTWIHYCCVTRNATLVDRSPQFQFVLQWTRQYCAITLMTPLWSCSHLFTVGLTNTNTISHFNYMVSTTFPLITPRKILETSVY